MGIVLFIYFFSLNICFTVIIHITSPKNSQVTVILLSAVLFLALAAPLSGIDKYVPI